MARRVLRLIILVTLVIALALLVPLAAGPVRADGPKLNLADYPVLYARQDAPANPENPIQIIVVGDTSLARGVQDATTQNGMDYPFDAVSPWLQAADLAVGNYEGVITAEDIGFKRTHGYRLRADPSAASALLRAGFDVLNLANNHTMDWGPAGLEATLDNLHGAGLITVGAGKTGPAARTPVVTTVRGVRIVWLSYTMIPDPPENDRDKEDSWSRAWFGPSFATAKLAGYVQEARQPGDILIVQFHWGYEYENCPKAWQIKLGRAAIEAGADLFIGHHPHIVQPFEAYHKGFIAYSLGNFVFDQTRTPGLALWIRVDDKGVIDVHGITLTPGVHPEWNPPQQTVKEFGLLCKVGVYPGVNN
jgi:poly-gamma-glutamate capsule biosynthesis protein CapA/YwtB (metallophosphatase superfamily)